MEDNRFYQGDLMLWKKTLLPAFVKVDDDEWGWWMSMSEDQRNKSPDPQAPPNDRRFGWKWTDQQVYESYKDICVFFRPLKLTNETVLENKELSDQA